MCLVFNIKANGLTMSGIKTMENEKIINWLLEGDVSIQYQVHREDLQNRIASEGWGFKYLSLIVSIGMFYNLFLCFKIYFYIKKKVNK